MTGSIHASEQNGPPQDRLTVIIATKNRHQDVKTALASVHQQSEPARVLVVDDASCPPLDIKDPRVTVVRQEVSLGCVETRQRATKAILTPYVAYVDDDAALIDENTLKTAVEMLDRNDSLAAVALPYREMTDNSLSCVAPDSRYVWITQSFTGLGSVIRISDFERVGGFRSHLKQQGEERDLCIRWLNLDKYVALVHVEPMMHTASPIRNRRNMHYFGRRNDVLFAWENLPAVPALVTLGRAFWRSLRLGLRDGAALAMAQGMVNAFGMIVRGESSRVPVQRSTYGKWQMLSRSSVPLSGATLPPSDIE